jgi:hypothetical protein
MWYENLLLTVPPWLESLRGKGTGRFRLSRSAFHACSIDATALALDLSLMLGLPVGNLEDSLLFFDENQDPETGFFHEPFFREALDFSVERILEMSGTYFGYQISAVLSAMGETAKYPFDFYRQLLPKGSMTAYMSERMPWDTAPMGAGNMVDHGATMVRANIERGQEEYREVLEEMYQWLDTHQDPDTGLWGNREVQGLNGIVQAGYHITRGTYFTDERPLKRLEKIIDTALESIAETPCFQAGRGEGCTDMDHFVLLERILSLSGGYRRDEVVAVASGRLEELKAMKNDDGGFSFEAGNAITNHNRYDVTPGRAESDLVGTVFYMETIHRICRICGLPVLWQSSASHGTPDGRTGRDREG